MGFRLKGLVLLLQRVTYCFAIETDVKDRMTKHIYIAGPYGRRDEAEALANELWENDFVVTSRWHSGPPLSMERTPASDRRICMQNWWDLSGVDAVVALVYPECRGTLVEIGAAIADPYTAVFLVGDPAVSPTLMIEEESVSWVSRGAIVVALLNAKWAE